MRSRIADRERDSDARRGFESVAAFASPPSQLRRGEAAHSTGVPSTSRGSSAHDGHWVARYSIALQISDAAALTRL